jgi:glycosyltransferase involved in cell wall biosynthesis
MDVIGGLAMRRFSAAWLVSERASALGYPPIWKYRLRLWLARRADGIVSNSRTGAAYWKERLGEDVRTWVVPNAVPIAEIEAAARLPRDEVAPPENPILLFAGRLSPEKNIENLIRAVGIARARIPLTAVLCGTGPSEPDLRRLVEELRLSDAVRFAGFVSPIWSWMKSADALALVSRLEGEPNAVLEAVACGCPLVLSNIPSHRELLGSDSALFVDPESPEDIAKGLIAVLTDRETAAARARAARRCLSDRSFESAAARYRNVYESLIKTKELRRCAG